MRNGNPKNWSESLETLDRSALCCVVFLRKRKTSLESERSQLFFLKEKKYSRVPHSTNIYSVLCGLTPIF